MLRVLSKTVVPLNVALSNVCTSTKQEGNIYDNLDRVIQP